MAAGRHAGPRATDVPPLTRASQRSGPAPWHRWRPRCRLSNRMTAVLRRASDVKGAGDGAHVRGRNQDDTTQCRRGERHDTEHDEHRPEGEENGLLVHGSAPPSTCSNRRRRSATAPNDWSGRDDSRPRSSTSPPRECGTSPSRGSDSSHTWNTLSPTVLEKARTSLSFGLLQRTAEARWIFDREPTGRPGCQTSLARTRSIITCVPRASSSVHGNSTPVRSVATRFSNSRTY